MTLSDHLAQFLLLPIKKTKPESKANNYCCYLNQFDPKVFLQDHQNIIWHIAIKLNKENVDNSFDQFFQINTSRYICSNRKTIKKKVKVNAKTMVNKRNNDIC